MSLRLFLAPLLLLFVNTITVQAQSNQNVNNIYGFVFDKESEEPLKSAIIEILNVSPPITAITDEDGKFQLKDVPLGRQRLLINLDGYQEMMMTDILVDAGKRVVVKIGLEEEIIIKKPVVDNGKTKKIFVSKTSKDKPINPMSGISARPFTIEEATRFAGARFDPARMVTNYAGATGYDNSRNDIVVRGNSPAFVLWQIEELPVENPNHVVTLGVGGGVTPILNVFALDNSDFVSGAFAAQYGNAISGVFDLRFRKGNNQKFGLMGQVGTQRAEILAEGPLGKKGASYLISGRVSTGNYVLKNIFSTDPAHQDVNIKISTGQQSWGELEFFALGGNSRIWLPYQETSYPDSSKATLFFNPVEQAYLNRVKYVIFQNEDYLHRSQMGMVGLKSTINLGQRTYWRSIIGATTHRTFYEWQYNDLDSNGMLITRQSSFTGTDIRNNYMLHTYINSKLSKNVTIKGGVLANVYDLNFYEVYQLFNFVSFDYNGMFALLRGYFQTKAALGNVTINAGINTQYSTLNKQFVAEPRFAVNFQLAQNHTLSFGYGLHNCMPSYASMLLQPEIGADSLGNPIYYTEHYKLKFIGSHHLNAQYDWSITQDFRLKLEAYMQFLYNVPVEADSSSYSPLNDGGLFFFDYFGQTESKGKGKNWGVELTLEKFFSNGYYGLFSASYYDSKFVGSNGMWFNTRFNSRYIVNALAGKEFLVGSTKTNALFTDIRISVVGGRPYSPIDLQATSVDPLAEEVYYQDQIFSKYLKPSVQVDFKIGFRLNANKVSHTFKMDLFNLTALFGVKNPYSVRYSETFNQQGGNNVGTEQIIYQRGFIPDITYTIQF